MIKLIAWIRRILSALPNLILHLYCTLFYKHNRSDGLHISIPNPMLPWDSAVKMRRILSSFSYPVFPYPFPQDLIWEILAWLPVKSLVRFKCVSKTWRSIILNPSFARAYRGGFKGILITQHSELPPKTDFFYASLDDKRLYNHSTVDHFRRDGPMKRMISFTDTVNGMVCFYYRNYSILYNIATRECMDLPVSFHEAKNCSYQFGFDPVNKLYKLLKICPIYEYHHDDDHDEDDDEEEEAVFVRNLSCEILTIGVDSTWRSIPPAPGEIKSRSVCFNGVLYWIIEELGRHLTAFHLAQEEFEFILKLEGYHWLYLTQFGPNLALINLLVLDNFDKEAVVLSLSNGNGIGGEGGVWAEHRLKLHSHSISPAGILPNGKVLVLNRMGKIRCPFPFYLYDQTKGELEEEILILSKSSSLFCSPITIQGYQSYHQENIIPLGCLC